MREKGIAKLDGTMSFVEVCRAKKAKEGEKGKRRNEWSITMLNGNDMIKATFVL